MSEVASRQKQISNHAHARRCLRARRQRPVRGPPIAFEPAPKLDPRGPLQRLVLYV